MGQALRGAALIVLGFQLAVGAWSVVPRAGEWLSEAKRSRWEGYHTGRRNLFPGYADGLEEVERRIRPGEAYVLLNEHPGGWYVVLQGDLAPRQALWLGGEGRSLPREWHTEGPPDDAPHWVVVFRGEHKPPELMRTDEYLSQWQPQP